jgi:N-acetyl-alpha-D-glucosaminyl L-malate synthase BshA
MKRRLKVGIACYPSFGGSGIVATNLGTELAKLGHQAHFFAYERPFRLDLQQKNIFFHHVPVYEYDLFKYPDYTLPLAVKMCQVHEEYGLDILHVHYAVPHATAAVIAEDMLRVNRIKPPCVVTTLHGTDITLVGRDPSLLPVVRYSIERSGGVTAVSRYLKEETEKIFQPARPVEVLYNFYTPRQPGRSGRDVRKELRIAEDDVLAIHASNLRPVKRIPDLLHIAAGVESKRFKLLILSGNDFAPFEPLVRRLGIEKRVIVKEKVLDIDTYLNASHLGIYTSQDETFGMGILESMSHGMPVVASRVGGVPEVLEDEKSGILCPMGDVQAFVAAINRLIEDPALRAAMGRQAKTRACSKFSAAVGVAAYVRYYRDVLKAAGRK